MRRNPLGDAVRGAQPDIKRFLALARIAPKATPCDVLSRHDPRVVDYVLPGRPHAAFSRWDSEVHAAVDTANIPSDHFTLELGRNVPSVDISPLKIKEL